VAKAAIAIEKHPFGWHPGPSNPFQHALHLILDIHFKCGSSFRDGVGSQGADQEAKA